MTTVRVSGEDDARAREREREVRGQRSEVIEVRGRTLAVTTSGDDEGAAEPRW